MTSGNAIEIAVNNVVIDLNGFKLGGLAAGRGTSAYGIYAFQRQNITIKNGTVRGGFYYGIYLSDITPYTVSQGHVVENIRADQNTWGGIVIWGSGNVIRNNQVVANGGSTLSPDTGAYGIQALGPNTRLLNNDVTQVTAQGTGAGSGISLIEAPGSVVAHNRISDITSPNSNALGIYSFTSDGTVISANHINNRVLSAGTSTGIYLYDGSDYVVSDNRIVKMTNGIVLEAGATGQYMNNLTQGVTNPYSGGTAAGSTNY